MFILNSRPPLRDATTSPLPSRERDRERGEVYSVYWKAFLISFFRIFPWGLFGSSFQNSTDLGFL